jgi:hypothetical protein
LLLKDLAVRRLPAGARGRLAGRVGVAYRLRQPKRELEPGVLFPEAEQLAGAQAVGVGGLLLDALNLFMVGTLEPSDLRLHLLGLRAQLLLKDGGEASGPLGEDLLVVRDGNATGMEVVDPGSAGYAEGGSSGGGGMLGGRRTPTFDGNGSLGTRSGDRLLPRCGRK